MEEKSLHFYPGTGAGLPPFPLARYLPPLPPGMAAAWLADNVAPGSWVLDPLGASPALVLEAARAGYRVLVACNNPILSFMIETLAAAPAPADFQAALAELASARRGQERLETSLQDLYTTHCDLCGRAVLVEAYLWRKGEAQPYARIYRCAHCGETGQGRGEHPITPADLEKLTALGGDKLQRARALQRVVMNEDENRADVEEALENYLPRPLFVLFTLLNKAEGLGLTPARLRLLHALLISAFDAGSTLWPHPGPRSRPKQLSVPPQFRENNLWNAFEDAISEWTFRPSPETRPIPVTRWPALPDAGGAGAANTVGAVNSIGAANSIGAICLFRGRVKALMPLPPEIGPAAVLTVFPRPNQAFWTLSALWSGWLWGAEAALPLRNVLDRRRYDWNWHTSAVHSALSAVSWNLPAGTPVFGLLPELAPGFLSAVVVASETSGLRLAGLACRVDQEIAQGRWEPASAPSQSATAPLQSATATSQSATATSQSAAGEDLAPVAPGAWEPVIRAALRADLQARNEPAAYLSEYAAGLLALAREGALPRRLSSIPGDLLTRVQAGLARTFADRSFLRLYGTKGSPSTDEERGWWWLADPPANPLAVLPLADRVEMEVVRALQRRPSTPQHELERTLCEQFPGLQTPPGDLLLACLDSYGELDRAPGRLWKLRPGDLTQARRRDLHDARAALEAVARRFGYRMHEEGQALVWAGDDPADRWWFFCMASSLISRYVLAEPPGPRERCVLVLPGSRARLLSFKLRRDPRLADAAQGWAFLKFRHLRESADPKIGGLADPKIGGLADPKIGGLADPKFSGLAETQAGTGVSFSGSQSPGALAWAAFLAEDPLTEDATQMALFS